jgi:predicted HD superfamily hydrolase involved in NAD metabolism
MNELASPDRVLEARARAWAQSRMSETRFIHTRGVVETVSRLVTRYDLPGLAALRIAGWIHDAAKECTDSCLLEKARQLGCTIRAVDMQFPPLLHGAVALGLARQDLGIDDPVITTAVLYHTTGHPDMSPADKAFYLADLIEPSRKYGWIEQARQVAEHDLDEALLFAITYQIRRLLKHGAVIDPHALDLRNKLLADGVRLIPRDNT